MAGFVGSRSLDERRRRRLATEDGAPDEPVMASPKRTSAALTKLSPAHQRGPGYFPLRKLISVRLWKLAGLEFLGLALIAAILSGGWAAEMRGNRLGPGFVHFFDLTTATLVRGFISLCLFLASQLALLIWWLRSQSLRDFTGRYRGWAVCAVVGFVAAFALQTNAAGALSETIVWLCGTRAHAWNRSILGWIGPLVCCGVFVVPVLLRDMRDCRLSSILMWLAGVLGVCLAAIVLRRPVALPSPQARMIECGTAMLCALVLFSSVLAHARNVLYFSAEPPAERPSRLRALLGQIGSRIRDARARRLSRPSKAASTARSKHDVKTREGETKPPSKVRQKSASPALDPAPQEPAGSPRVSRQPKPRRAA